MLNYHLVKVKSENEKDLEVNEPLKKLRFYDKQNQLFEYTEDK